MPTDVNQRCQVSIHHICGGEFSRQIAYDLDSGQYRSLSTILLVGPRAYEQHRRKVARILSTIITFELKISWVFEVVDDQCRAYIVEPKVILGPIKLTSFLKDTQGLLNTK